MLAKAVWYFKLCILDLSSPGDKFCPNWTCLHKSLKVLPENSVEKKYHQKWLVFKSYYNTVNKIIHIFVHEVLKVVAC